MYEKKYMKLAIALAEKAYKNNEVPIGAVIVDENGKVIGKGYNKKEKTKCVYEHAEIIALQKACKKIKDWRLNNCIIYTTLEPCPMCASAIEQSRIQTVYYGCPRDNENNTKIVKMILKDKIILVKENKCSTILSQFFKNKRKLFPGK